MGLNHKRILITEINFQTELHMDILQSLLFEEAAVFVFLSEFSHYDELAKKFPSALPLLVNIHRDDGESHVVKLLSAIPPLTHILNFTGEKFNKSLSRAGIAYKYKTEDSGNLTAKEVTKKLLDAGNSSLILNFSTQIQNLSMNLSSIKEKMNVTLTESRKSIRRMFSLGPLASTSEKSNKTVGPSLSAPATLPHNEYKVKMQEKHSLEPTKHKETQNRMLQQENEKVIKVITKLGEKCRKKYCEMEKNVERKQSSKEKEILRAIKTEKKKEKTQLLEMNEQVNSQTLSRSGALSAETANRIVASRNARVDKEVDRNAERKFKQGQEKIVAEISEVKKAMIENHYKYIVEKQIKKFLELQKNLHKL